MNLLDSTEVHNTDDDGCFDEKQYEEINRLSQESLERRRNAVLSTCGKQSEVEERVLGTLKHHTSLQHFQTDAPVVRLPWGCSQVTGWWSVALLHHRMDLLTLALMSPQALWHK